MENVNGRVLVYHFFFLFSPYTLFFYRNIVFPAEAEYSYFSADFRLKISLVNILRL